MSEIERYRVPHTALHPVDYDFIPAHPTITEVVVRYSDHLARIRDLESQLATASKFPDDGPARPQLAPPTSPNDEARRWAEYADWLERSYVAQNRAWGEAEKDRRALESQLATARRDLRRKLGNQIGPSIFRNRELLCSSHSGKGTGLICSECADDSAQEVLEMKLEKDNARRDANEAERLLRLACATICDYDTGDQTLDFLRQGRSPELADIAIAIDLGMTTQLATARRQAMEECAKFVATWMHKNRTCFPVRSEEFRRKNPNTCVEFDLHDNQVRQLEASFMCGHIARDIRARLKELESG